MLSYGTISAEQYTARARSIRVASFVIQSVPNLRLLLLLLYYLKISIDEAKEEVYQSRVLWRTGAGCGVLVRAY